MSHPSARGASASWTPVGVFQRSGRLFPFFAVGSLLTALLVITLGGVVRVTGSGLGCPDWPLCHGRLIPPPDAKAWIEYLHRLSVSLTSVFVILMAVTAVAREGFRRGSALPLLAPVLLVVQALLGAATVRLEINPGAALAHTVVAMTFVGTLAIVVTGVAPWATAIGRPVATELAGHVRQRRVRWTLLALAVVTFLLILSGSYVYRAGAPLACVGYPFCGTAAETASARGLQDIHMLHRYVALASMLLTGHALGVVARLRLETKRLWALMAAAAVMMALQVALGASNVLFTLPEWARLGHLVAASLVFALIVLTAATVWHGYAAPPKET